MGILAWFSGSSKTVDPAVGPASAKSYLLRCEFWERELAVLTDEALVEFARVVRDISDDNSHEFKGAPVRSYGDAKALVNLHVVEQVNLANSGSLDEDYRLSATRRVLSSYFKDQNKFTPYDRGQYFKAEVKYTGNQSEPFIAIASIREYELKHSKPGFFGRHRIFRDALIGTGVFLCTALIAAAVVAIVAFAAPSLGVVPAILSFAGKAAAAIGISVSAPEALALAAGAGLVASGLISSTVGLLGRGVRSVYRKLLGKKPAEMVKNVVQTATQDMRSPHSRTLGPDASLRHSSFSGTTANVDAAMAASSQEQAPPSQMPRPKSAPDFQLRDSAVVTNSLWVVEKGANVVGATGRAIASVPGAVGSVATTAGSAVSRTASTAGSAVSSVWNALPSFRRRGEAK